MKFISSKPIKIMGIRPPEADVTLQDYEEISKEISVTPRRTRVPSLSLFYVGTLLDKELHQLGYKTETSFYDLAASQPDTLSDYSEEFAQFSEVKYGSGKIYKRLRGKPISELVDIVRDSDICFMSSLFTAGAS